MQLAKIVYARHALLQWKHKCRSNALIEASHAQVFNLHVIYCVKDYMHHYEEAQSTSETVVVF
jgi:hypothetical protein